MQYRNTLKRKLISMIAEPNMIKDIAFEIMDSKMRGRLLNNPTDTQDYLKLRLGGRDKEFFTVVFLDNRHRIIEIEDMFEGTIDSASVYPREVLKAVLNHNAAAVIFSHCHPSGISEPSQADRQTTTKLTQALALIDVRVLDHIIVGDGKPTSMAERGLM